MNGYQKFHAGSRGPDYMVPRTEGGGGKAGRPPRLDRDRLFVLLLEG